jgi:GT2 family glycosyltransferase
MSIDLPRSASPRVSVIIPSSTRHDLLHACLQSLARFGPTTIPYETIVVLSEATPEAETRLRKKATGVQVVSSPINLGLVGAGNRGRALASGEENSSAEKSLHSALYADDAYRKPRRYLRKLFRGEFRS